MPSCFPGHTRIPFPKIIVKNNAHTHCPYSPEQLAIIGQAGLAHPVGQPIGTALGAGHDTGSLQLPNGAAPLIAPGLGHFSLRNRHG